jgi:hypothetical protein
MLDSNVFKKIFFNDKIRSFLAVKDVDFDTD